MSPLPFLQSVCRPGLTMRDADSLGQSGTVRYFSCAFAVTGNAGKLRHLDKRHHSSPANRLGRQCTPRKSATHGPLPFAGEVVPKQGEAEPS